MQSPDAHYSTRMRVSVLEQSKAMISSLLRVGTWVMAISALSAAGCGGGGDEPDSLQPAQPPSVRLQVGGDPPAETETDQDARSAAIISRVDSLIISTSYGITNHKDFPTLDMHAQCSGTTCTFRHPGTGVSLTLSLADLQSLPANSEALLTKHGITLVQGKSTNGIVDAYGSVMTHALFAVQGERTTLNDIDFAFRYGIAGGDLTGSTPAINARWTGVMVGTGRTGSLRQNILQGDAFLEAELRLGSDQIKATFSDIQNITTGAAHTEQSIRFENIPISPDGTFRAGLAGNRIQGGFYGPGHAESAGIFERSNIVGAFGAKRN